MSSRPPSASKTGPPPRRAVGSGSIASVSLIGSYYVANNAVVLTKLGAIANVPPSSSVDANVRSPDASWIALDRWKALPIEARRAGFAAIVPDFVAELRSPTDDPRDLKKKMREYIREGVRLGWLIDPIARTAWIYRPGRDPEKLLDPATLSGEDVLPGFVLDLKPIFDEE